MPTKTRVLLVDRSPLLSEALGVAISLESDITHVGSAATSSEAIELVTLESPDVVVVDMDAAIDEADYDGVDVTERIKEVSPKTRVLILAERMEVDTMARAAAAGACGFLSKSSTLADISAAIRAARGGGMFVEHELIGSLLERLSRGRPIQGGSARADLTRREQEVLTLLGEGLDVVTIAKKLEITPNTCRGHVKSLLSKLGSHSQLEAVVEAVHQGLLPHLSR